MVKDTFLVMLADDFGLEITFVTDDKKNTVCLINEHSPYDNELMAFGTALCFYADEFSKKEGQMVSLDRALNMWTDKRDLRTRVWDRYHSLSEADWNLE